MKKIRLTEKDLYNFVEKVIKENENKDTITMCADVGIKTPGFCKGKRPVAFGPCALLGIKTPGYCEFKTKRPVKLCNELDLTPKNGCKVCYTKGGTYDGPVEATCPPPKS